jgi:hypothetical protein
MKYVVSFKLCSLCLRGRISSTHWIGGGGGGVAAQPIPSYEQTGTFYTLFGNRTAFPHSSSPQLSFRTVLNFTRHLSLSSTQAMCPVPTKAVYLHSLILHSDANGEPGYWFHSCLSLQNIFVLLHTVLYLVQLGWGGSSVLSLGRSRRYLYSSLLLKKLILWLKIREGGCAV